MAKLSDRQRKQIIGLSRAGCRAPDFSFDDFPDSAAWIPPIIKAADFAFVSAFRADIDGRQNYFVSANLFARIAEIIGGYTIFVVFSFP